MVDGDILLSCQHLLEESLAQQHVLEEELTQRREYAAAALHTQHRLVADKAALQTRYDRGKIQYEQLQARLDAVQDEHAQLQLDTHAGG